MLLSGPFLRLEVGDDVLAEHSQRVHGFLVAGRADGAQAENLLDAQGLVVLHEADAVVRGADAEVCAALDHLIGGGVALVRPGSKAHIPLVVALIVGRHCCRVNAPPNQPRPFPLLFQVPTDQLGAALNRDPGVFMAEPGGHQRVLAVDRRAVGSVQALVIQLQGARHPVHTTLAAHQGAEAQLAGAAGCLLAGARGPKGRMRLLQRLGQHVAGRYVEILPVVADFLFSPDAGQHFGELLPHPPGMLQVGSIGR